ncbi:MAG: DNA repair protein RadA [Candidatus Uhrbacteria bacterium]
MFTCQNCDAQFSKWSGRCSECQKWGTLNETDGVGANGHSPLPYKSSKSLDSARGLRPAAKAGVLLSSEKATTHAARISSGETEVDRVLGGGVIPGSLILISGEPGIGKSTLVAQIAASTNPPLAPGERGMGGEGKNGGGEGNVLYISGEESASQLTTRFERLNKKFDHIKYLEAEPVEVLVSTIEKIKPILTIVDSIQTVNSLELEATAGSPNTVRYATNLLLQCAKQTNVPIMIIGQVTKDGSVAGPKTLEHLVDVVLSLEGDPVHAFRILRATKNRFGSTDEVGVFEMAKNGLVAVPNPSERFLAERQNSPGSVITAILEGSRVFLVEVQALVEKSFYPSPVRRASGFDVNRLQMLSAILSSRVGANLGDKDIYVNVIGGMELKEPAADLAVCAAIMSALKPSPAGGGLPRRAEGGVEPTVYFGEVGLGGEVRSVLSAERRLSEAARVGLKQAVVPQKNVGEIKSINVAGIKTVRDL